MGRRGYPAEVRRRALDQVAAGRSVFTVAQELGVSVQVIYAWRKSDDAGQSPDHAEADADEARDAIMDVHRPTTPKETGP